MKTIDLRVRFLAFILLLWQYFQFRDYLTDDSFIYARFARNLAERGELVFNPGEAVHAATSPLWAGLGAVGVQLGFDAFLTLKVLGMLCGLGALFLFGRLAERLLPSAGWAAIALLIFATEPWMVRWSASGMETPLGVILLLGILLLGLGGPMRAPLAIGFLSGLAVLVRPEFLLLAGLLGLAFLRVNRAATLRFAVGVALPLAVWAAVALPLYGHLLPETMQAKSTPLGLQLPRFLSNLKVLTSLVGLALALPAAGFLWGLLCGHWRPRAGDSFVLPALWVWSVALPLVYLLRDVQVVSRYLELILPVVLLLGLRVLAGLPFPRWVGGLGLAQAAVGLVLVQFWIAPSTAAFSRTLAAGLDDICEFLEESAAESDVVAIYDIGYVGYRSDLHILDLGGLVHPGINDLRNRMDDREILEGGHFLQFGQPRWLVDRDGIPEALAGQALGDRIAQPILSREVANLGLSRGDPVHYTLYRLD